MMHCITHWLSRLINQTPLYTDTTTMTLLEAFEVIAAHIANLADRDMAAECVPPL